MFNVACKWWDTKHTMISKESNIVKSTIDNILLNKAQLPMFSPKLVQELILNPRETEGNNRTENIQDVLEMINETELEKETSIEFGKASELNRGKMSSSTHNNNSIIDTTDIKLKSVNLQKQEQSSTNVPIESTKIEKNKMTYKLVSAGHIIPHVDKVNRINN